MSALNSKSKKFAVTDRLAIEIKKFSPEHKKLLIDLIVIFKTHPDLLTNFIVELDKDKSTEARASLIKTLFGKIFDSSATIQNSGKEKEAFIDEALAALTSPQTTSDHNSASYIDRFKKIILDREQQELKEHVEREIESDKDFKQSEQVAQYVVITALIFMAVGIVIPTLALSTTLLPAAVTITATANLPLIMVYTIIGGLFGMAALSANAEYYHHLENKHTEQISQQMQQENPKKLASQVQALAEVLIKELEQPPAPQNVNTVTSDSQPSSTEVEIEKDSIIEILYEIANKAAEVKYNSEVARGK